MSDKWHVISKNKWSLVIHEVTQTSVTLWVGTLFHDLRKPERLDIVLKKLDGSVIETRSISQAQWERPFPQITSQRFYKVETFKGLRAGQHYLVEIIEQFPNRETLEVEPRPLDSGSFATLPKAVNDIDDGFTIAIGSCFYEPNDGGQVSATYETLLAYEKSTAQPHVTFLTGDQVYLDIGADSLSVIPKEVRDRVANDYAVQWQALRGVLRHGGNWFLADDHEYWNNYPFVEGWSPFIQALRIPSVKRAWRTTARDGLLNVQRVKAVRTFDIGSDVSFCLADLRSFRTKHRILPAKYIESICEWLGSLSSPGVLVLSQPIIEPKGKDSDRNFVSYESDYSAVVKAIEHASHDVLVLSGDIHYGRISSVKFKDRNHTLHEVVSSPMSNLSGLSSIAVAKAEASDRLTSFPAIDISGVPTTKVKYNNTWSVSTQFQCLDFRYLRERTKEHFMTLRFNKTHQGKLSVEVRAWLCREKDAETGLPEEDWSQPVKLMLN